MKEFYTNSERSISYTGSRSSHLIKPLNEGAIDSLDKLLGAHEFTLYAEGWNDGSLNYGSILLVADDTYVAVIIDYWEHTLLGKLDEAAVISFTQLDSIDQFVPQVPLETLSRLSFQETLSKIELISDSLRFVNTNTN